MKSLIVFSYKQPTDGIKIRWGVLENVRDCHRHPVGPSQYRWWDKEFKRSKTLATLSTIHGVKQFYLERTNWKIKIPFIGSLIRPLLR